MAAFVQTWNETGREEAPWRIWELATGIVYPSCSTFCKKTSAISAWPVANKPRVYRLITPHLERSFSGHDDHSCWISEKDLVCENDSRSSSIVGVLNVTPGYKREGGSAHTCSWTTVW